MVKPVAYADYRKVARRRLPRFLFDYVDGGSFDEETMARNNAALRETRLRQRVLVDVSHVALETRLFGMNMSMPVMLAPVGLAGMMAPRGEVQAARAAASVGVPFCLSTVSICGIEEVAAASERPFIFQLYMAQDRGIVADLLARATAAGCTALMLTVDLAKPGFRYRDFRSGLNGQAGLARRWARMKDVLLHPGWALDVGLAGRPHKFGNMAPHLGPDVGLEEFMAMAALSSDASVNWTDIAWVRQHWSGPIILKGILDREDAMRAAAMGVEGLVVSNHGGRQLDGVAATCEMLPLITDAVGDRMTVLVDGGVRSGLDVLRMLALGAKGVMMGRPWIYALAAGGRVGVQSWLRQIGLELTHAMALAGSRDLSQVGPQLLDHVRR